MWAQFVRHFGQTLFACLATETFCVTKTPCWTKMFDRLAWALEKWAVGMQSQKRFS